MSSLQKIGVVVFWVSWPVLYLMLRFSHRTRGLVVCKNKIVVVKPWLSNGKWGLPGGGVHRSEASIKALTREVSEEVGLTITPKKCKLIGPRTYKQNGLRFNYQLFMVELSNESQLQPQKFEIAQAQWLPVEQLSFSNSSCDVLDAIALLT